MIRSSIDIGTNSVLLLVANVSEKRIQTVREEQQIPRLGEGVDDAGILSENAQKRVLTVLSNYKKLLDLNYPEISANTIVTATSAVRDAQNRSEFIENIYQKTGWRVRLLSGSQEAKVTYKGALSVLGDNFNTTSNIVLDIGGGSTEIAAGRGKLLKEWNSLNIGSVRFTERFLNNNPPTPEQINTARKETYSMLSEWSTSTTIETEKLIGVAGTVTSMAGIDMNLEAYIATEINGHSLSHSFIESMIDRFTGMSAEEIEELYPVFLKGRGDVILGGLIILSEFMDYCRFKEIIASTGGIRHGILMEKYQ